MKLKRNLFPMMMAALLALAAPAAAQNANEEQERTRAHAEAWASQGLTMIGEVTAWDDDSITVSTTTGAEHVVLTPQTKMNVKLEKGMKVAVDYNRNTQGAIIAEEVRFGDVKPGQTGEMRMKQTDAARAGAENPNQGYYVVGTVVTFDDDSIVLKTDKGNESLVLTPVTQRTYVWKVGDPVRVDYTKDKSGNSVAREVRQAMKEEQTSTRAHHRAYSSRGLTMIGEVMSVKDDALVVSTITGAEHVVLTPDTRMSIEKEDIDKGEMVAVDYNRSTQGVIIAEEVRDASPGNDGASGDR